MESNKLLMISECKSTCWNRSKHPSNSNKLYFNRDHVPVDVDKVLLVNRFRAHVDEPPAPPIYGKNNFLDCKM